MLRRDSCTIIQFSSCAVVRLDSCKFALPLTCTMAPPTNCGRLCLICQRCTYRINQYGDTIDPAVVRPVEIYDVYVIINNNNESLYLRRIIEMTSLLPKTNLTSLQNCESFDYPNSNKNYLGVVTFKRGDYIHRE